MRKADRHWLMIVVPMISLLLLVAILMQQHSATTTADVVKAKVLQLRTVPYSDIRTLIDELGNPAYRTLSCRQMLDDISSGECAPGALIRLCSGVLYLARPDDLKDIERSIETLLVNLGSLARGDEEGLQVVLPALKKHSAPCNKAVDRMLVAAVEGKPRACALMTGILLAENRERLRSLADLLYLDHGLDTETQTAMLANLSTWLSAADSAAGSVSSASEGLKAILVRDFPELETARGLRPHVAEELLATVVLQSMSTDRSFQGDKKFLEGISRRFTSSSLLSTIWGIDRTVFTRQIENPDWRLSYLNGRLTPFVRITPPSAAQLSSVKPREVFARLGAEASIKANLPASRATAASLLFYAGQFQDCHALLTEELLQFIEIFDNEMSKTLRRYQKISSRYIHQLVPPGSDSASGTAEESTVYDQLIADFTEAVTRSQDVAKTSSDIGELEEWTKALCLHSEFGMRITDDQRQILAELAVDCVERMTKLIREGGGEPYRIAADPGFIYLYKNARFQKIVTSLKPFWICVREAESGDVADVIRNARGPDALSFGDTERHPLIVSPFSEGVLYEIDRRWSTGERIRVELPSSDEWRYVANPCPWWVLQLRSQPTIGELFIQSKRFDAAPPTTGSKLPNAFGVFDLPGSHGEWLNDVLPPGDKALKRAGGGHWHSNDVFNDYESRVGIFGRGGLMAIRLVLRPI